MRSDHARAGRKRESGTMVKKHAAAVLAGTGTGLGGPEARFITSKSLSNEPRAEGAPWGSRGDRQPSLGGSHARRVPATRVLSTPSEKSKSA